MPLAPETYLTLDGFSHASLWISGESVWGALARLDTYLEQWSHFRIECPIPAGVHLVHPERISIGKGTLIEPGVYIEGPCVIGEGVTIRHGAYLRGGVILGDKCAIGHAAEIKHSILLGGAAATHFVYVGDSILGRDVNLGAGVKCANLRLDRREVSVSLDGKKVPTGLRKFGAVVGDGCQIGCNSVLNPGTLVGRGVVSRPLTSLSGVIPAGKGLLQQLRERWT